MILKYNKMKK